MNIGCKLLVGILLSVPLFSTVTAQDANEHRQVYLGLIHHVKPSEAETYVLSNRLYASALASHSISEPILQWSAYANDTYDYLWLYPIEHLNDIEALSSAESRVGERAEKEHWNTGSDLHQSVDHSEEFVMRDEPSLSRMPENLGEWASQACEFRLYYTYGGYGGSDSQVRENWRRYMAAIPIEEPGSRYRVLRVLIGLERPLWVVEHCGSSWEEIDRQKERERKAGGAKGTSAYSEFLKYVRKTEVWRFRYDAEMAYPKIAGRP